MASTSASVPESSRKTRSFRLRSAVDVATTALMLVAAGSVLWLVFGPSRAAARPDPIWPDPPIALNGAPRLGSPTAPFVVIEFSDFECPYCRKFAQEVWPDVKARFVETGQIQVSFRHFPLMKHPHAQAAAEAAVCAERQRRFWPMADALFGGDPQLDSAGSGVMRWRPAWTLPSSTTACDRARRATGRRRTPRLPRR